MTYSHLQTLAEQQLILSVPFLCLENVLSLIQIKVIILGKGICIIQNGFPVSLQFFSTTFGTQLLPPLRE